MIEDYILVTLGNEMFVIAQRDPSYPHAFDKWKAVTKPIHGWQFANLVLVERRKNLPHSQWSELAHYTEQR